MASVTTTEFARSASYADSPPFSLIEQKSLVARLALEFAETGREFSADPRAFVRELFSADTRDAKRRRRLYLGLTIAVVVHASLLIAIAVIGWRTVFVKKADYEVAGGVVWVPLNEPKEANEKLSNAPRGDKSQGGGGGGDSNPHPATKGPLPLMTPGPQIVKPNTPSAPLPTIQLPPTIVGPESTAPPVGVPLGVPNGVIAEAPSPGPGSGEGMGGKSGTGAGPGSGSGSGPGTGGGSGGKGRMGLPNASDQVSGPIPYNLIRNYPESKGIVWVHRPTPIITPEAQANKVQGDVQLRATFNADGTITDIVVIRDVLYMAEQAVESLRRSTFHPATVKGRPVTVTNVIVTVKVSAN